MKMVSVLVQDTDALDWVPQGSLVTAGNVTLEDLADARTMGIIGQSAGIAFWRAHRADTPLPAPPAHMIKREPK